MHEDAKETLGFVCRWAVLGLAWVVVVGVAMLLFWAAKGAHADLTATLVVPDFVTRPVPPGEAIFMGCWVEPFTDTSTSLLWTCGDGAVRQGGPCSGMVWLQYGGLPAQGRVPVRVLGNPYGSLTARSVEASLYIMPPGRMLFLVDARMVDHLTARGPAGAECKDLLLQMRRRGDVVLIHPGRCDEMAEVRVRLRLHHVDDPILCPRRQNATAAVDEAASALAQPSNRLAVVTDAPEFAAAVRQEGRIAWLIQASPASQADRFWRFESPTKLKAFLTR